MVNMKLFITVTADVENNSFKCSLIALEFVLF